MIHATGDRRCLRLWGIGSAQTHPPGPDWEHHEIVVSACWRTGPCHQQCAFHQLTSLLHLPDVPWALSCPALLIAAGDGFLALSPHRTKPPARSHGPLSHAAPIPVCQRQLILGWPPVIHAPSLAAASRVSAVLPPPVAFVAFSHSNWHLYEEAPWGTLWLVVSVNGSSMSPSPDACRAPMVQNRKPIMLAIPNRQSTTNQRCRDPRRRG
jgi:hypothetical protein